MSMFTQICPTLAPGNPEGPGGPGNPGGPLNKKRFNLIDFFFFLSTVCTCSDRKYIPSGVCCEYPVEEYK